VYTCWTIVWQHTLSSYQMKAMFHAHDAGQDRLGIGLFRRRAYAGIMSDTRRPADSVDLATMVDVYLEFESPSKCWKAQFAR